MSKRRKPIWNAVLLIIILVILIPCGILVKDAIIDRGEQRVELYYMMVTNKMKPIEKDVTIAEPDAMVQEILQELRTGAKNDGVMPSVPENLEVKNIAVKDKVVTLNFSTDYFALNGAAEVICRSAIVWSLTSLDFVEGVIFTVDGNPLLSKTGEDYGVMNRGNILIDAEVSATTTEYAIVKLYFSNPDASELVVEDRVVEVNANQPRERTILEQLIAGPKEKGNYATIPAETKIREVTTTGDGICYVNLSQEFVSKHGGGSTGELLTIYSIVNSLCELETVEKVQFLIEGEKLELYKGHVDFSTPFVAVSSLGTVGKVEKTQSGE